MACLSFVVRLENSQFKRETGHHGRNKIGNTEPFPRTAMMG